MHILNKHFDHIYVLYIRDELDKVKPKIDKENVQVEYFKGIDGYVESIIETKYDDIPNKRLSHGQYGHLCSFINIMKDAIQKNYNRILILESDIYFAKNLEEQFMKYNDLKYKILYLGASQYMYYNEHTWTNIKIINNYYHTYKTLGTFAIGIDKSIYEEYFKILLSFIHTSDVGLLELQQKYPDECLVTYPNLIACNLVKSNTATNRRNTVEQIFFMQKYKWDPLFYNLTDYYTIKTQPNEWYAITFETNTKLDKYYIEIKNILKLYDTRLINSIHKQCLIYFKAKSNISQIICDSIFMNYLNIVHVNKNVVSKCVGYIDNMYKNTYLVNYYMRELG